MQSQFSQERRKRREGPWTKAVKVRGETLSFVHHWLPEAEVFDTQDST